ncbi:hypothetical protein FB451DRAFT_1418887 [Mycena latifolia]|nr:hypothetical protein FB451DRAFT_1418887 [Mycena latifolia]
MHLPPALLLLTLTFALDTSAASSSSPASASASAAASSNSSAIGTPTNSAAQPSLSAVSPCVANRLGLVAAAANCSSELARKTYAASLVACLTACPGEVSSAEALVEQFCAAAIEPISISFPSFAPSSSSAASAANSGVWSSAATMALTSSSAPPSTPRARPTPLVSHQAVSQYPWRTSYSCSAPPSPGTPP